MTRVVLLFETLWMLAVFSACASLEDYVTKAAPARSFIMAGDFASAASVFPDSEARGLNEVLVRMERGMILHDMGRYRESFEELEKAARRIRHYEERAVISASATLAQAGSLVVNEQVSPYEGEDFEKIMIHALNAVNFLMEGDLQSARVEVRRAYARQEELSSRHEKILDEARRDAGAGAWSESLGQADQAAYDAMRRKASTVASAYHNTFASVVSALVYEMNGEPDEAYVDMKKAHEAYPGSTFIASELIRLSAALGFRDEHERWKRMFPSLEAAGAPGVRVVVFFSHGLSPVKVPLNVPIPLREGFVFASIPVYRFTPSLVQEVLVIAGDRIARTSTVLDVDAVASRNYLDSFPVLFARQIARTALKAQALRSLSREHGAGGALVGTLFAGMTERADLRAWSTLPKEIQAGGIFVPEQVRQVRIQTVPGGVETVLDIPWGARLVVALCRLTDAGLSVHARSY